MRVQKLLSFSSVVLVLELSSLSGTAQQHYEPNVLMNGAQPVVMLDPRPGIRLNPALAAEFRRKREEKVAADMARLTLLTNELKEELAKRDANTLSVTSVAKAKEIEKLAKDLRKGLTD